MFRAIRQRLIKRRLEAHAEAEQRLDDLFRIMPLKDGDTLLAKERARTLFFDYMVIETHYIENNYVMLGWIVKCHNN